MEEIKGYIIENGKRVLYQAKDGKIVFSNGKEAFPSLESTDFKKAYALAKAPVVEQPFELYGTGSGRLVFGTLANQRIKIKPGRYDYISIPSATKTVIDATGVIITNKDVFAIDQCEGLEIFGFSAIDHGYRPLVIYGHSNGFNMHGCTFKNVKNYCLSYGYTGIYDGTSKTSTNDWRIEGNTYINSALSFQQEATYTDKGITNVFRNFTFKGNKIDGKPDGSNVLEMKAVADYTITDNTVDAVNMTFPDSRYPNGIHNGVFLIWGWGTFSGNKITNSQGNSIRAWGFSFGDQGKEVVIDHNIVHNIWKYGAFEYNIPPEICEYRNKFPDRISPINLKCFKNTGGRLSVSKSFDGQMLDLYNTQTYTGGYWGGTIEYYDNLGFEMHGTKPVTDMINNMSDFKIIRNSGNKYFPTASQAVADTIAFKSLHQGIGA